MIGLFFEVEPKPGHEDRYFETAASLRPALERNGGVGFVDRFRSTKRSHVILSCQHWEDEAHLLKWRNDQQHQGAQRAGREIHFADYRIWVAPAATLAAVKDQRWIIALHHEGADEAHAGGETFASVYREGAAMTLFDETSGLTPDEVAAQVRGSGELHIFTVARSYSMTERAEAPQSW